MSSPIVSLEWLNTHLHDDNLVIVDCRFTLGKPDEGRELYGQAHIPNAFYLDLERDLSGPKEKTGGRHPLPDMVELASKLGNIGINTSSTVVAYDDQGGAMASRLWWLLSYMGVENVYVLDEGFTQWKKEGNPVTADVPENKPVEFKLQIQHDMLMTMAEVKHKLNAAGTTLIDSREEVRYRGEQEPIDPVAGHIPGAINHFWKSSLDDNGKWKTPEQQKERFKDVSQTDEVIVYCGSGVTACPNVLALKNAGYKNVKLYLGSWSDWISYPDNPIERH